MGGLCKSSDLKPLVLADIDQNDLPGGQLAPAATFDVGLGAKNIQGLTEIRGIVRTDQNINLHIYQARLGNQIATADAIVSTQAIVAGAVVSIAPVRVDGAFSRVRVENTGGANLTDLELYIEAKTP